MKKVIVILSLMYVSLNFAQKLETVHSFAREIRDVNWYQTQQKLWKEEVDKDKKNGEAWLNYFRASRALSYFGDGDPVKSEEIKKKYTDLCQSIVDEAYKLIPNSFEANFMRSIHMRGEGKEFLLKANEINPNDPRIFDGMMIHYETLQQENDFANYCRKMFQYNVLPASILNWGYNILSELDENAVLFTAGDNDTYACWIVQQTKNFRKDVQIINTSLILEDDYRNRVFKKLNIPALNISIKNSKESEFDKNVSLIFKHLIDNHKVVYSAGTSVHSFQKEYENELFLTGLAYKFSKDEIENTAIIRRNFEKRYLLDYLSQSFSFNIGDKISDEFNSTYLPAMLKLYKSYKESEEISKMKELENLILMISEKSGQKEEVSEVLKGLNNSDVFFTESLNVKELEQKMLPLKGKLYLGKFELTNAEYRLFLDNLKRSQNDKLFQIALYDSTAWNKKFTDSNSHLEPMINIYNWHPAYDNYPIVNLSYEGAKAYCDWLTVQYNLQRKRKYTKVIFRLPTEKEWLYGAGSGNENAKTCFPNDDPRCPEKKCYLANYKPAEDNYFLDGGFHQVRAESYKPNKMGFYNMFGNVSEMIDKNGVAKGGSWYNSFEECDFQKNISYNQADCGVGVRIVMEIIEE
ncbi:MAG: SUMF1/EgtB/PvdO family nonheme iron enzyme [Flavobacteriia bacterium]|jgi:formylglycine-generating enzyme required for sulfatase activity